MYGNFANFASTGPSSNQTFNSCANQISSTSLKSMGLWDYQKTIGFDLSQPVNKVEIFFIWFSFVNVFAYTIPFSCNFLLLMLDMNAICPGIGGEAIKVEFSWIKVLETF